MPEGDPKDLPAAPKFSGGWSLGKPDLVVKMPKAYHVPAEGRDIYRNFAIAMDLNEDKWVRAIDFRPRRRVGRASLAVLPRPVRHVREEGARQRPGRHSRRHEARSPD